MPETPNKSAVILENISESFGCVRAVVGLDLKVKSGEKLAFLGPSGAGKTTVLRLIGGEIKPEDGRVLIDGVNLSSMRPGKNLAGLVGMIHQRFDLVPNLSVLQNVLVGRLGEWGIVRSLVSLVLPRDQDLALAALRRVGIDDRMHTRAGRLSGGEQQRVAIARLLIQNPSVLLADEPVASLDRARAREVMDVLVSVAAESGKTLIASMHSVELACRYFDRLVGIRNGKLNFDIPSSQINEGILDELYALDGLRNAE